MQHLCLLFVYYYCHFLNLTGCPTTSFTFNPMQDSKLSLTSVYDSEIYIIILHGTRVDLICFLTIVELLFSIIFAFVNLMGPRGILLTSKLNGMFTWRVAHFMASFFFSLIVKSNQTCTPNVYQFLFLIAWRLGMIECGDTSRPWQRIKRSFDQ